MTGTMLALEITMEQGRVAQQNFGDYPLLRMPNAPPLEVHFIESDRAAGPGTRDLHRAGSSRCVRSAAL